MEEAKKSISNNEQAEHEYIEKNVALMNEAFNLIRKGKYFEFFHSALFSMFKSLGTKNDEALGADQLADEIEKILSISGVNADEINKVETLLLVLSDADGFQNVLRGELGFSITSFLVPALTLVKEKNANSNNQKTSLDEKSKSIEDSIRGKTFNNLREVFFEVVTADIEKLTSHTKNTEKEIGVMGDFYYVDALGWKHIQKQLPAYAKYIYEKLPSENRQACFFSFLKLIMEKFPEQAIKDLPDFNESDLSARTEIERIFNLQQGIGDLCFKIFDQGAESFISILSNYDKQKKKNRQQSMEFFRQLIARKPQNELIVLSFLKMYLFNSKKLMIFKEENKNKFKPQVKGKGNKFLKWLVVALEKSFGLDRESNIDNIEKEDLKDRIDFLVSLLQLIMENNKSGFSANQLELLAHIEVFMATPIAEEHKLGRESKVKHAFNSMLESYDLILFGKDKIKKEMILEKVLGSEEDLGSFLNILKHYNDKKKIGKGPIKFSIAPDNKKMGLKMSRKASYAFFQSLVESISKMKKNDEEKTYQFLFILHAYVKALYGFELEDESGKKNSKQSKFLRCLVTAAQNLFAKSDGSMKIDVMDKDEAMACAPALLNSIALRASLLNGSFSDSKGMESLQNLITVIVRKEPAVKEDLSTNVFNFIIAILFAKNKLEYDGAFSAIEKQKDVMEIFGEQIKALKAGSVFSPKLDGWGSASITQIQAQSHQQFIQQVGGNNNNVTPPPPGQSNS